MVMQFNHISYLSIQSIQEHRYYNFSILQNISSNHDNLHFLMVILHTSRTLPQTLQSLIQFFIIMTKNTHFSHECFHLIPSLYRFLFISPYLYKQLIPSNNSIVNKININKFYFLYLKVIITVKINSILFSHFK